MGGQLCFRVLCRVVCSPITCFLNSATPRSSAPMAAGENPPTMHFNHSIRSLLPIQDGRPRIGLRRTCIEAFFPYIDQLKLTYMKEPRIGRSASGSTVSSIDTLYSVHFNVTRRKNYPAATNSRSTPRRRGRNTAQSRPLTCRSLQDRGRQTTLATISVVWITEYYWSVIAGDTPAQLHARDAQAAITQFISLLPIHFYIDTSIFTEERELGEGAGGLAWLTRPGQWQL